MPDIFDEVASGATTSSKDIFDELDSPEGSPSRSMPPIALSPYDKYRLSGAEPVSGPFGPANPEEVTALSSALLNPVKELPRATGKGLLPAAYNAIGKPLLEGLETPGMLLAAPLLAESVPARIGAGLLFGGMAGKSGLEKMGSEDAQTQLEGRMELASAPLLALAGGGHKEIPPVLRDVPAGITPAEALVPSIREIGGKVITGQPGDTHVDIIKDNGIKAEDIDQRGFSDPKGQVFLDREAAAKGTEVPTEKEQGRLHSTDLIREQEPPAAITGEAPQQAQSTVTAKSGEATTSPAEPANSESNVTPTVTQGGVSAPLVGMGGATPQEFTQPGSYVSNMFAAIDRDRAEMSKPPMEAGQTRTWDEDNARALAQMNRDPSWIPNLIQEVSDHPRPLLSWENAGLVWHRAKLKAEANNAFKRINQAFEDGRSDDLLSAKLDAARFEDELDGLDKVVGRGGTGSEAGRSLQAQKMGAGDDFSLVEMRMQARAAQGGGPLSEAKEAEIAKLHDDLQRTQKAFDEHVASSAIKVAEAESRAKHSEMLRERQSKVAPAVLDVAERFVRTLDTAADKARERIKARGIRFSAGLDPTVLLDVAEIGASHIAHIGLDFAKWSVEMVKEFGEAVKPHLDQIYKASQKNIDALGGSVKEATSEVRKIVKGGFKALDIEGQKKETVRAVRRQLDEHNPGGVSWYAQRLARAFVERGVTDREKLIDQVHAVLKEAIPTMDRRQAMDAISGYGDFKQLSKDEISVKLRDLKGQMQQLGKLEDMANRIAPKKSGVERRAPTDEERRLIKQVEEAKRRGGFQVTDPETQLRSALQEVKTRLANQINDLEYQLNTGIKIVKEKRTVPLDKEAGDLKARRDALKAQFDSVFGNKSLTDAQRVKIAMDSVQRQIEDYERRIKEGDFKAKPQTGVSSPELEALKAKRVAAKSQFEEFRDLDEDYQKEQQAKHLQSQKSNLEQSIKLKESQIERGGIEKQPRPVNRPADPLLEELMQSRDALNKQLSELRRKPESLKYQEAINRKLESLKQRITERQAILDAGNFSKTRAYPSPNLPLHPELEVARQQLGSINSKIRELSRQTPEQRALKAFKSRTANRIADLADKIAKGDFSTTARKSVVLDSEAVSLKAINERLKKQFQRGKALERLKQRSTIERSADWVTRWRRGFILSGPVTLAKLTSAAVQRLAFTPLEEAVGSAIGKVIPSVASKAPREGGFNVSAEAKAFADSITKGLQDSWKVLRTGQSDLDVLYGKEALENPRAIDFFGHVHGALKAPAKRAEFARSLEKRSAAAIRGGADIQDPMVQSSLIIGAYKDANRAIFLQDNMVSDAYKNALRFMERKQKGTGQVSGTGTVMATTARVLLPIVKVPTNIVAETFQYALGSVTGSARLARAFSRGIDTIKPEEADLIMRELKKGSIGAAVMLLGYFNPDVVGGYYQPREKRAKGDAKSGSLKLYGHNIPSFLLHNPLLETLQIGATVRRVSDAHTDKRSSQQKGIGEGVYAAGIGLTEEIPFVREMTEVTKAFNPSEKGAFFGELGKSLLVPQAVQSAATFSDKDAQGNTIPRKPRTVVEHIKTGIPGLRQEVPRNR